MEIIKNIKENTKMKLGLRFGLYGAAIACVILGGLKYMVIFVIFIFGFIAGKYYEKTMSAIRDWRLLQKVNKVQITDIEYLKLKEENEKLTKIMLSMSSPSSGPRRNDAGPGARGGRGNIFDFEKYGYAGGDEI